MKRVFFDMDGVLAEYRSGCTENDMKKQGYFKSLKPEANMLGALEMLCDNSEELGIGVCVLTKIYPSLFRYSAREKMEWRDCYMPNLFDSEFIMVNGEKEEKSDAIKELFNTDINGDCILIDDYNRNLKEWADCGGTAVKYVNGINDKNRSFIGSRIFNSMTSEEIYNYILSLINGYEPINTAA